MRNFTCEECGEKIESPDFQMTTVAWHVFHRDCLLKIIEEHSKK